MASMSNLVCLGYGYCARHFAARFGSRFSDIAGTTRSLRVEVEPRALQVVAPEA